MDIDGGEAALVLQILRAAAFPRTSSVTLRTSCSATHLLLTAVSRPPPLEVEVDPVPASRLRKGVYPLSRGHVHLLRPGGNPCFLEHDGKAPLPGQHAGDEVLLVGTGPRVSASSECSVGTGRVERGRCAGSRNGVRGRCPLPPPGVSCPSPALPRGPLGPPGQREVPRPWGMGSPPPGGPRGGHWPVLRGWIPGGLHR